jgi:hypothetical protein
MPSRPILQACANTVGPSASTCSFRRRPPLQDCGPIYFLETGSCSTIQASAFPSRRRHDVTRLRLAAARRRGFTAARAANSLVFANAACFSHKSHRITLRARAVTLWLPDAPMPANQPTIEKVPVPCDRCHGTGINAGIECSECGGKGHRVVIGGKMAALD